MHNHDCTHLCVPAVGLAVGITKAVALFVVGIGASLHGVWAMKFIEVVGTVYVGYVPTLAGSFVGALYALAVGFCLGALLAFLYNFISDHCSKACEAKE